jgi:hypothetical protein
LGFGILDLFGIWYYWNWGFDRMGYAAALDKAWEELQAATKQKSLSVRFLADNYQVDITRRKVFSLSCNVPAKDFPSVIILHYLVKSLSGLPQVTGQWLDFRQLSGVEGYWAAFKKRAIDPLIRKYGASPEKILDVLGRFPGKKEPYGDYAVAIEAFDRVPVLLALWEKDEEFAPEANIFLDKSAKDIFCIEDMIVLAGLVCANV